MSHLHFSSHNLIIIELLVNVYAPFLYRRLKMNKTIVIPKTFNTHKTCYSLLPMRPTMLKSERGHLDMKFVLRFFNLQAVVKDNKLAIS